MTRSLVEVGVETISNNQPVSWWISKKRNEKNRSDNKMPTLGVHCSEKTLFGFRNKPKIEMAISPNTWNTGFHLYLSLSSKKLMGNFLNPNLGRRSKLAFGIKSEASEHSQVSREELHILHFFRRSLRFQNQCARIPRIPKLSLDSLW